MSERQFWVEVLNLANQRINEVAMMLAKSINYHREGWLIGMRETNVAWVKKAQARLVELDKLDILNSSKEQFKASTFRANDE